MCRSGGDPALPRLWLVMLTVLLAGVGVADLQAEPQLGQLVSPGRLTRAHGKLEGIDQCQSCHETGRRVTPQKCLACHAPIAQRIRAKRGIHRSVTDDCVTCHVEHMGVDAELRPFDTKGFDHAGESGFPLDGKHAAVAANCQACHKTRSFLSAKPECASCHADVHKGALGAACASCHPVTRTFKDATTGFDHTRTAYPLTGAHKVVACASCHPSQRFKGLAFQTCASCHADPHQPRFAGTCASCHVTTDTWRTKRVDHAKTAFPLKGRHQTVECAACHTQPAMKVALKADRCSTCHTDVHKGAFAPKDCNACHTESGFGKAPFDHTTTAFALTGAHATARCEACHTRASATPNVRRAARTVEFRGLKGACLSCHTDPHQAELGVACETCHQTTTFTLTAYSHQRPTPFFEGAHATVGCALCHEPVAASGLPASTGGTTAPARARSAAAPAAPARTTSPRATSPGTKAASASATMVVHPVRFTAATTTCVSCHADVHLGQVSTSCETCHAVTLAKFQLAPAFSHGKARYPLTGKHATVACGRCHQPEVGTFPAGAGTAVRLTGLAQTCASCHADVHLGQIGPACETCHTTASFAVKTYTHRDRSHRAFFSGRHATATCVACHPSVAGRFPGGAGTALNFSVDARCANCHRDVHNGSLGPNCLDCHKPDDDEENLVVRARPVHERLPRRLVEAGAR